MGGSFLVALPPQESVNQLGESKAMANKKFCDVERRLPKNLNTWNNIILHGENIFVWSIVKNINSSVHCYFF